MNGDEISKVERDALLAQHKHVKGFYESPAYNYAWDVAQNMMKDDDETALTVDPVAHPADIARAQGRIRALQDFFVTVQSIARGEFLPPEEDVDKIVTGKQRKEGKKDDY